MAHASRAAHAMHAMVRMNGVHVLAISNDTDMSTISPGGASKSSKHERDVNVSVVLSFHLIVFSSKQIVLS